MPVYKCTDNIFEWSTRRKYLYGNSEGLQFDDSVRKKKV